MDNWVLIINCFLHFEVKKFKKLNINVKTNYFIYILHNVLTWSWSFFLLKYSKNYLVWNHQMK